MAISEGNAGFLQRVGFNYKEDKEQDICGKATQGNTGIER